MMLHRAQLECGVCFITLWSEIVVLTINVTITQQSLNLSQPSHISNIPRSNAMENEVEFEGDCRKANHERIPEHRFDYLYPNFDVESIKQNFDDRGMDIPHIETIKYQFRSDAPKNFADGGHSGNERCAEMLNVVYSLDNREFGIYLKVEYDCMIHGHSGGIADYDATVTKFSYTGAVDQEDDLQHKYISMIIADHIICDQSKVVRKSSIGHDIIYKAIERYLQ